MPPSRAGAGGRPLRVFRTLLLLLAAAALLLSEPAARGQDAGGYPDATMPCEWSPHSRTGPPRTQWCKDFDWGPAPATLLAGQETVDQKSTISARGFGYRNCTDFVAYKLGFDASVVHGNAAQWKGQVPPANVTGYAAVGSVAWWGPELFDGFGHVAVVLSVHGDGSAVVGEYNYYSDGTYDTRVIPSRGADAFLHIRDESVPGGVPFSPGRPPPAPAPAPRPAPAPAPAVPKPPPPPATLPAPPPSPTPASSPTPPPASTDPDVRTLATDVLGSLDPAFVSFHPPRVMRPGAEQLVEARIDRADRMAAEMDLRLSSSAGRTGAARAPLLPPGTLMSASLQGPGFQVTATTPAKQAVVGTNVAVWQWRVTPQRRGSRTLRLCLSVDLTTPSGVQPSSPTCSLERPVRVTAAPPLFAEGFLGGPGVWLLGIGIVAALTGTGVIVRRKRRSIPERG